MQCNILVFSKLIKLERLKRKIERHKRWDVAKGSRIAT